MNYTEIVKKLIGNVQPYGATHIDEQRFENLKAMCLLVNNLVMEIDRVSENKERQEFSMREMGNYAYNFLTEDLMINK